MEINWNNVKSMSERSMDGREYRPLDNPVDALRFVAIEQFAFPGGYEAVAVTTDGGSICADCVRREYAAMYESTITDSRDGWAVAGLFLLGADCDYEDAGFCDHCGRDLSDIDVGRE